MPGTTVTQGRSKDWIRQFSVFTPNRVGRLHDLVGLFGRHNLHVLAITVLDTTETAIIRLVVDDPDKAADLLNENGFQFTESHLVGVEGNSTDLARVVAVLLQAEVNINYLYSFIPHPHGHTLIGLSLDDPEIGESALGRNGFRTLTQSDISR